MVTHGFTGRFNQPGKHGMSCSQGSNTVQCCPSSRSGVQPRLSYAVNSHDAMIIPDQLAALSKESDEPTVSVFSKQIVKKVPSQVNRPDPNDVHCPYFIFTCNGVEAVVMVSAMNLAHLTGRILIGAALRAPRGLGRLAHGGGCTTRGADELRERSALKDASYIKLSNVQDT